MEFGNCAGGILEMLVLGLYFLGIFRVDDTNRFGQIAKRGRVRQVQNLRLIISNNPRENWILRQIVVRSSGNRVQLTKESARYIVSK